MSDAQRTERVPLDGDVSGRQLPDDAWAERYREHTQALDNDASEALAGELFEVIRLEPFLSDRPGRPARCVYPPLQPYV